MTTENIKPQENTVEPDETKEGTTPQEINQEPATGEDTKVQADNQPPAIDNDNSGIDDPINMYHIYTDNIASVRYYLKIASDLNGDKLKDRPPYQRLKALLLKIKHVVPMLQFIYENLFIQDIKAIQKLGHKIMLDKKTPENERIMIARSTERMTELIQHLVVNRGFIIYILWQNKHHLKTLTKMLKLNIGTVDEKEMEDLETNCKDEAN